MKALRFAVDRNKCSPDGSTAVGFGLRVGYWPCLSAPFVQVQALWWSVSVWHGRASWESA